MKKPILNASAISLGTDGRVEIADDELLRIERDSSEALAGGANTKCGGFNNFCQNIQCGGDSLNDTCGNYQCNETNDSSCVKLVTKPL